MIFANQTVLFLSRDPLGDRRTVREKERYTQLKFLGGGGASFQILQSQLTGLLHVHV